MYIIFDPKNIKIKARSNSLYGIRIHAVLNRTALALRLPTVITNHLPGKHDQKKHGNDRGEGNNVYKDADNLINSPEVLGRLEIPEVMYHVTSEENATRIVREGLLPNRRRSSSLGEIRGVYLTANPQDISKQGGDIEGDVILAIETKGLDLRLDPEYFYYDDKSTESAIEYVEAVNRGEEEFALYSIIGIPASHIAIVRKNVVQHHYGPGKHKSGSEQEVHGDEEAGEYKEGRRVIQDAYNSLPSSLKSKIANKFVVEKGSETRNMGTGKGGIVIRISPEDIRHPVIPEHEMLHSFALDQKELQRYKDNVLNVGKTIGYSQSFAQYHGDEWKLVDEDFTSSLHSFLSETHGFHGPTFETGIRIGIITAEEANSRREFFSEYIK